MRIEDEFGPYVSFRRISFANQRCLFTFVKLSRRLGEGYYTIVRFAAMIILGCIAFVFYKEEKIPLCIVAGSLALLFQPFIKITLDKVTWNIVDVLVAIGLVFLWYKKKEQL